MFCRHWQRHWTLLNSETQETKCSSVTAWCSLHGRNQTERSYRMCLWVSRSRWGADLQSGQVLMCTWTYRERFNISCFHKKKYILFLIDKKCSSYFSTTCFRLSNSAVSMRHICTEKCPILRTMLFLPEFQLQPGLIWPKVCNSVDFGQTQH